MSTSENDMFVEAIEAILVDRATPAAVRAIERGESPQALWSAIAEAGFLELLAPEERGGAALPLIDVFGVIVMLGRHAVPAPVTQAIVARALLDDPAPGGMITIASNVIAADGWSLPSLPYAAMADHVIVACDGRIELFATADATAGAPMTHGSSLATLAWPASPPAIASRADGDAADAVAATAAAVHAALICGALNRVFEMTLAFCNDRVQFGKPIGKFQSIQHQLSVMAEHVAAATVAAEAAFDSTGPLPALLPAAMAKARASEAAALVANIAHALHGAIGFTEEYDLQLFTRRLHEWRVAHGSEDYWNRRIGRALLADTRGMVDFVRHIQ
ncbi:acyl-CoA dehydrogenase family protein [soil metagenome]